MKTPHRHIIASRCIITVSAAKGLALFGFVFASSLVALAQEFCNVEYLCCDWGSAMKLASKPSEKPQFSDKEEEVYFLKQVFYFTRKKRLMPDLLSGSKTEDIGHGVSIYLCKMKADGSNKTEIKELWKNPNDSIDTQTQSTWMDVNEKTRKIALSITFAGNDITGLWTVNLDGSVLKRIITPEVNEHYLQAINHPSWTPDGQSIVFEERLRGIDPNQHRIVKCDAEGRDRVRLTDGPRDQQPAVSPDGKWVAFIHWTVNGDVRDSWLWLVNLMSFA